MTHKAPYVGLSDPAIWLAISQGSLPEFPDEISRSSDRRIVTLRDGCRQCWERDVSSRPVMKTILMILETIPLANTMGY